MSRNTIDLAFADGEYVFALPLPRIDELQRKTGVGIGGLFRRLNKGIIQLPNGGVVFATNEAEFHVLDVIETIRQGLIGGGKGVVNGEEIEVTPSLANKLIENYVLTQPLVESWKQAFAVIGACIVGYDPPKKDEPAKERAPRKRRTKKASSTTV